MRSQGASRQKPRQYSSGGDGPLTQQDLMSFMAMDPEVVNTTDQVPQAFDSIAATFGFKHHVGTDAAMELKVIKTLLRRETLLSYVRSLVEKLSKAMQDAASQGGAGMASYVVQQEGSGLLDCLTLLREATADTIEAIVLWREGVPMYPPPAFIWQRRNYLLKMHKDLDFLAEAEPLVQILSIPSDKLRDNPLMLSETLRREQQAEWEAAEAAGGGGQEAPPLEQGEDSSELARLSTLGKVLVMEVKFEEAREKMRAAQTAAMHSGGQMAPVTLDLSGAPPPSRSVVVPDPNLWRKKINVFNWFDEAQGQLKSLRKSMELGQVVLRALGDRAAYAFDKLHHPAAAEATEHSGVLQEHQYYIRDKLVPLAAKAPNPAQGPQLLRAGGTAPPPDDLRHPLEAEDPWAHSPMPVPFTREVNQALILRADRKKKLPSRSFIPKGLENVRSRYMDAPKRPMTPSEYDRVVLGKQPPPSGPGVRKLLDRRRQKAASAGPAVFRGGKEGEEEDDDYSVSSMREPTGHDPHAERPQPAQRPEARRPVASSSLHDITLDDEMPSSSPPPRPRPAAREAKVTPHAIASIITEEDVVQLGLLREPPKALAVAGAAVLILLAPENEVPANVTWPAFQSRISSREHFLRDLKAFHHGVPHFKTRALRNFITCSADMLPGALVEHSLAGAKVSAWVFQVLLLQPDFSKHAGRNSVRSVVASIKHVLQCSAPQQRPSAEPSPPESRPAADEPKLLYSATHMLCGKPVFVSIAESDSKGTSGVQRQAQIKVYDPATSAEMRAALGPEDLKAKFDASWVDSHLDRIAWWDQGGFRLKEAVPAS